MFLERIRSEGLAHISYIVGSGGYAAVIDPRRDCRVYVEIARRERCRISHIFETHRNEDYVIGSLDLARMTGAAIYHGSALPFTYGQPVAHGDTFELGRMRLQVLATPGHTDESISIAVADLTASEDPVAVFSGDALLVGDVGRTDFFPGRLEQVAGTLYDSIFGVLLPLGDDVMLLPAHGAGSVCGGHISAREFSTLGYERRHNHALQARSRAEFVQRKLAERHGFPPYFARMEQHNLHGAPALDGLPDPPPLPVAEFAERAGDGMLVLDVRSPESFGGAHIPGSLVIPLALVPVYAGWFVPYDQPIGLVVEEVHQVETAVRRLIRIGYDEVVGSRVGMGDWETSGREFATVPLVTAHEVTRRLAVGERFALLDVRSAGEFQQGHLPGAVNIPLQELEGRLSELPERRPLTTFCGSGTRAIIAASLLLRAGLERLETCMGSMAACSAAGCPVELGSGVGAAHP